MKIFIVKSLLFVSLLSCGNGNQNTKDSNQATQDESQSTTGENQATKDELAKDANIRFTIKDTTYEYQVRVIASPIKSNGNTSISIAESLGGAASLSLNFIFDGQETGTYQITSGFPQPRNNEPALGFRFAQPAKRLSYDLEAQDVEVKVTNYDLPAKGRPSVEGTFSGILIDPKSQETFEIKDGFFSTKQNP